MWFVVRLGDGNVNRATLFPYYWKEQNQAEHFANAVTIGQTNPEHQYPFHHSYGVYYKAIHRSELGLYFSAEGRQFQHDALKTALEGPR